MNDLNVRFEEMQKRFIKDMSTKFGNVRIELVKRENGYQLNYNLGTNYIINSLQVENELSFNNLKDMIQSELELLKDCYEDFKTNLDNYDMDETNLNDEMIIINFFKLELLRNVLDDSEVNYDEDDEDTIAIIMENDMCDFCVYVNVKTLEVSDDLSGKLYKNIDDVIVAITNK